MTPDQIKALITGLAFAVLAAWLITRGVRLARAERAEREQRARDLMHLAGIAVADDCGCRFWDSRADRADFQPCDEHTDQLLRDVTGR